MTVLRVVACRCIRQAHCHSPGTRGHLQATVGRRTFFLSGCRYCRRKDERL